MTDTHTHTLSHFQVYFGPANDTVHRKDASVITATAHLMTTSASDQLAGDLLQPTECVGCFYLCCFVVVFSNGDDGRSLVQASTDEVNAAH